ncbi:hypothetical protein H1P_630023 [Hyella patelloides LEGE 07179]|uniref:Uncharacterized protein n=1 Tax=Hyella patelloides LEGE 07179 TaxID=945734 RepID=A0A563W1T4_9CYAN|nr:hypothetical protein H1P_630023 [Hyella patelloides LEGE 07179]
MPKQQEQINSLQLHLHKVNVRLENLIPSQANLNNLTLKRFPSYRLRKSSLSLVII